MVPTRFLKRRYDNTTCCKEQKIWELHTFLYCDVQKIQDPQIYLVYTDHSLWLDRGKDKNEFFHWCTGNDRMTLESDGKWLWFECQWNCTNHYSTTAHSGLTNQLQLNTYSMCYLAFTQEREKADTQDRLFTCPYHPFTTYQLHAAVKRYWLFTHTITSC